MGGINFIVKIKFYYNDLFSEVKKQQFIVPHTFRRPTMFSSAEQGMTCWDV